MDKSAAYFFHFLLNSALWLLIIFISINQCGVLSFLTHYPNHISIDIKHDMFPINIWCFQSVPLFFFGACNDNAPAKTSKSDCIFHNFVCRQADRNTSQTIQNHLFVRYRYSRGSAEHTHVHTGTDMDSPMKVKQFCYIARKLSWEKEKRIFTVKCINVLNN